MRPVAYFSRSLNFCAGHRLKSDQLSREENEALYGRCYHPSGHGHNFQVVVTVRAPIDPVTGTAVNLSDLTKHMDECITDHLDHKNLDKDIEYFFTRVSTVENLAVYIWERLTPRVPGGLYEVKVSSTPKNSAIYRGETDDNPAIVPLTQMSKRHTS